MTSRVRMHPGAELPPVVRHLGSADLVAYAGATWDWHRLHHDQRRCEELGLAGPVVDGQMFGALLAQQVQDAFGPQTRIVAMSFRFASMVHAGETVEVRGTLQDVRDLGGHHEVVVAQHVHCGDRFATRDATTRAVVGG